MKKIYLHYDMDAFFASVEQRDNPELKGIPIAVGYGIVTTASYEARKYGVKSAMPAAEAKKLCPNLKFVTVRKNYYGIVGRQIQDLILKITKKCEFTSIDEGYIDITEFILGNISNRDENTDNIYNSKYNKYSNTSHNLKSSISNANNEKIIFKIERFIKRFKNYIYKNTKLTCSVGIGFSKISAKIASDINKPDGYFIFKNREHFLEYIYDKELSVIPGIGKKTREFLAMFNVKKVSELHKIEKKELIDKFGANKGEYLYNVIRGLQFSEIENERKHQSYGHEVTFNRAINDETELEEELRRQSVKLAKRLENKNEYAKTVTLKIRYSNFSTYTKAKTLVSATRDSEKIFSAVQESFKSLNQRDDVRLIGVHLSSITKSNIVQLTFNDLKFN